MVSRTCADAGSARHRRKSAAAAAVRVARWIGRYSAAASVVIAASAAIVVVRERRATPAPTPVQSVYQTKSGQYATVRLADSSEVILAPESKLTIAADYAGGNRTIALDGEAIFNVHHDAAHPLRVMAREAMVEDIGTRFDLRAYPFDDAVTVAVVEGAAAISDSHVIPGGRKAAPLVLRAGDVGEVDHDGSVVRNVKASAGSYLSWSTGTLSFRNRPLPEVLRELSHWYGIEVRVLDAQLARRTITADFARDSSSATIDALALTLNATVERTPHAITLAPK